MSYKIKSQTFSFFTLTISLGFLFSIVSSGIAWESQNPELAQDWGKMMGFKASDKVGKVAPEIKPGMVIDSSNYKKYPGLAELLPKSLYERFDPKSYAPLAPIKIKETNQYHLSRGCLEGSLKNVTTCHLAEDGLSLVGFNGGIPFIHPKNGNELVQWVEYFYSGDTFAFRPMHMMLYGRNNRPERVMRQEVNNVLYFGCTDWRKPGSNPEMLHHVGSGTFIYPRDISGVAYTRKRYVPADKPDEFLLYVPSMRRIRKMSGKDTQDPLFGSDLTWDDYKSYWQKLSTTEFPNEYKMLPEREMLAPTFVDYDLPVNRIEAGYPDYKVEESGGQIYLHFGSWQRRPVLPLEIISKDSSYMYSKRVLINDMESTGQLYEDMYDQAGRLWRTFFMDYNLSRKGEGLMWEFCDIVDLINNHRTILDFNGYKNPRWMGDEYTDVRFLSRKAK